MNQKLIFINGLKTMFAHAHISYEDVVRLVQGDLHVLHTVVYRVSGRGGRTGTLAPGEEIPVVSGLVINCFITSGA